MEQVSRDLRTHRFVFGTGCIGAGRGRSGSQPYSRPEGKGTGCGYDLRHRDDDSELSSWGGLLDVEDHDSLSCSLDSSSAWSVEDTMMQVEGAQPASDMVRTENQREDDEVAEDAGGLLGGLQGSTVSRISPWCADRHLWSVVRTSLWCWSGEPHLPADERFMDSFVFALWGDDERQDLHTE